MLPTVDWNSQWMSEPNLKQQKIDYGDGVSGDVCSLVRVMVPV